MTKYLLIALFILILALSFFFNEWLKLKQQNKEIATYAIQRSMEVEYYKLENGQLAASKGAVIMEYNSFKKISEDKELEWIKQFDGIKKNMKNLEVATQLNTLTVNSMKGNVTDTVVVVDSSKYKAFSFNNVSEYTQVTGIVIPELKTVETRVTTEVPLEGVLYWKRKKIVGLRIGRKEWTSDFTSRNPDTKITGVNQLLIRKK